MRTPTRVLTRPVAGENGILVVDPSIAALLRFEVMINVSFPLRNFQSELIGGSVCLVCDLEVDSDIFSSS